MSDRGLRVFMVRCRYPQGLIRARAALEVRPRCATGRAKRSVRPLPVSPLFAFAFHLCAWPVKLLFAAASGTLKLGLATFSMALLSLEAIIGKSKPDHLSKSPLSAGLPMNDLTLVGPARMKSVLATQSSLTTNICIK